jgi:hypothetical protein
MYQADTMDKKECYECLLSSTGGEKCKSPSKTGISCKQYKKPGMLWYDEPLKRLTISYQW